jgi:tRNA A37 methylthiotransferase MiaB
MQKFTAKFIGKKIEVLAEEYHAKGKILEGLTGNYLRVKFKGAKKSLGTIIKIIYYQRANLAPRLQYASKKAP